MTSPIRSMKNSNYNYQSNTSQNYEQEFWKIKAQKAEITIQDLKKQNHILNKRIIQMSRIEQQLRQKIIDYEDDWKNRSRKLSTERNTQRLSRVQNEQKELQVAQIERLYKEIRIIKNVHEVELTKLQDQNKKLKKQIQEGSKIQSNDKEIAEYLKIVKNLNEQVVSLKRKISNLEDNLNRVREQKARLLIDNEELSKQIQQYKMRQKIAQKQEEDKFLDYKKYIEQLNTQRIFNQNKPENQGQAQDGNDVKFSSPLTEARAFSFDDSHKQQKQSKQPSQVQKLEKQLTSKEKQIHTLQQKLRLMTSDIKNERLNEEIKLKKVQGDLAQAKSQLQNVLRKLAPLLKNKEESSHSGQNIEIRVGLTILQVFLKKYKIKAF